MADPTSIVTKFSSYDIDKQRHSLIIKDSEALVHWALVSLNRSLGRAEFADDASDLIPAGLALGERYGAETLTGDTAGSYGVVVRGGIILKNVSVTGVTASTDISKFVYATDGQTLTLTKPATGVPQGVIVGYVSTTYCDVYLFDMVESIVNSSLGNQPTAYKSFGTFLTNAIQGNVAAVLHTETAKEHYQFVSLHALPKGYDNAVVAGAQTLNLQIGATDVTGGVLTLGFASFDATGDMGTIINATAITADNEVHIGNTVILEMAGAGTGFTADAVAAFEVFAIIERLPGA
jgi:hypothetical protein